MSSMPPNGYGWRVADLERRMALVEDVRREVAVLETKIDNLADAVERVENRVGTLTKIWLSLAASLVLVAVGFALQFVNG